MSLPSPVRTSQLSTSIPPKAKLKSTPAPLSIPTSKTKSHSRPALPITPHRTTSDPLPPPTTTTSVPKPKFNRVLTDQPKSAGYVEKNVRFGFGRHAEDGNRLRGEEGNGKEGERYEKASHEHVRHPHESHVNVLTECGRHGDDWLFGGWSVGGMVKRVFSGRKKE